MNKFILKELVPLTIMFFTLLACDKKDETVDVIIRNEGKATLSFSPNEATWFKRTPPDSVVVQISGGFPPYVIIDRPLIHSALIRGDQLIIYPTAVNTFDKAIDFINIQDNNRNVNTFNIKPETELYFYPTTESFTINVSGDTSITRNSMKLIGAAIWDPVAEYIEFSTNQDSLLIYIRSFGIKDTGTYTNNSSNLNFGADNTINGLNSKYINPFYPINNNQVIEITELSKTKLKGNFIIDAASSASSNNPNQYVVKITGYFSFSK